MSEKAREIRFRAWDKEQKKMINFDLFGLDEHYIYVEGNLIPEDAPIMQYTGLKDSQCKEIYEGDIVRIGDEKIKANERFVFCKPSNFAVEDTYDFLRKLEKVTVSSCFKDNLSMILKELEIIGNIYENPELLEERGSEWMKGYYK